MLRPCSATVMLHPQCWEWACTAALQHGPGCSQFPLQPSCNAKALQQLAGCSRQLLLADPARLWLQVQDLRERLQEEHQALLQRDAQKAALEQRIARLTKIILHSTRVHAASALARRQRIRLLRSFSAHHSPAVSLLVGFERGARAPAGAAFRPAVAWLYPCCLPFALWRQPLCAASASACCT